MKADNMSINEIAREIENLFGAELSEVLTRKGATVKITVLLPDTQYVVVLKDRPSRKIASPRERGKLNATVFSPFGMNMKEIAKVIAIYFNSNHVIESSRYGINESVMVPLDGSTIVAEVKNRKGGNDGQG